ncbi:uncharacterized protein [Elaeis guineensis]|uniref:Uncharacterized protein LOC105052664 n=1 Tax=Elaeis guineensis var. tenera TaxID=51953 RepID=A0A6I9S1M9_ELAGV|nr:uncharacterized protein LOC105052664 [Elaeis guineensis]XP_029122696.1 uncharacterized protein LOC105052664 [Elaeis guineensis]XP_029122697.1 uncharacterized protein LOC105052664 [Elaeis guineensis]
MADSFTIQISSNLVNRLSGDENNIKKKTKKPKAKVAREPHQPKVKPTPNTPTSSSGGAWPLQPPMFLPVAPPPPPAIAELEAIRSVLQESERVVEKLEKQESSMLQELNQRAKELRNKEFKLPYQNPIPCTAEREACLQCYKEHAKDPLKCAQVVKNFADCARQARQQVS